MKMPSTVQKIKHGDALPDLSILIREGSFTVTNLTNEDEILQSYSLRHRIFCEELKWVPPSKDLLETDKYDNAAVLFGVFDEHNKLIAYLRLILSDRTYMLENEFSFLVQSDHKIRKETDTAEVSRLCMSPEARTDFVSGNFGMHSISMLLYKGLYHWCAQNNIRYIYLVVEYRLIRLLRTKGFPCRIIGQPVIMPDGIIAVAGVMDWRDFESINSVKRPTMLGWFSQYRSTSAQGLSQQPGSGLQHQASAGWF